METGTSLGAGMVDMSYSRSGNRLDYTVSLRGLNGYRLRFAPVLPAHGTRLLVNGSAADPQPTVAVSSNDAAIHFNCEVSDYFTPALPARPSPGSPSRNVIV